MNLSICICYKNYISNSINMFDTINEESRVNIHTDMHMYIQSEYENKYFINNFAT